MERILRHIAHIRSDFPEKFGIPRQARLAETEAKVIFEPEFRRPEAFRGLEGFSHIWLIWEFSEHINGAGEWMPAVRPPKLGGNVKKGVFATRSPNRPNPIGISAVKLLSVGFSAEFGPFLEVSGADLMDGTPIYDIKPYIKSDSIPDALCGFTEHMDQSLLKVDFPAELLSLIPKEKRKGLSDVLAEDPRPSYQNDPLRDYGVAFAGFNIKFRVSGKELKVISVTPL